MNREVEFAYRSWLKDNNEQSDGRMPDWVTKIDKNFKYLQDRIVRLEDEVRKQNNEISNLRRTR